MGCTFRADRLRRVATLEDRHFWFTTRRRLVAWLVSRWAPSGADTFLDVGCGTGRTLASLAPRGAVAIALDYRSEGFGTRQGHVLFGRADVCQLPLRTACADVVLALDVLEHVDDLTALEEIHRVLRPGGVMIATVPAFTFLWSFRDEDAGHLRRYTPRALRRVLRDGGFTVRWLSFHQFVLFPVVAVMRMIGRRSPAVRDAEELRVPLLNPVLEGVGRLELLGMRLGLRYPWGTSLVAVATAGQAGAG